MKTTHIMSHDSHTNTRYVSEYTESEMHEVFSALELDYLSQGKVIKQTPFRGVVVRHVCLTTLGEMAILDEG